MARLVVIDPDRRIRAGLARMISTAGHVADEFDTVDAAISAAAGADLVFASAGPGGSAIDATMAALQAGADAARVVWTGPVAAMIRPAVDAGVGVDCLELPTRLPALNGLLARHLTRTVGDRWAGDTFLRQVSGKGDRFPPIRVLFLAHRLGASGILRVGSIEITLQQGRIADAKGLPEVGSGAGLMHAIGMAIGQGTSPDAAMQAAGVDVMSALIGTDAGDLDVSFTVENVRAPVVLPMAVPRLLALALETARPVEAVKRDLAGRPSRGTNLHAPDDSPETAWGLTPVALRVVRAAKRARTLGHLVAASGGAEKDAVWTAVDFLLHLGIVCFDDSVVRSAPSGSADADVVFSDIVIEAVEDKPADPRAAEYLAKAAELEATPPWDLFELEDPADVSPDHIDARFRKLSIAWHPDRFTGAGSEVADAAAACFAALGDARDRFDDEGFRGEVRDRLVARREGRVFVSESEAKQARMAFTRGEHAARRKDWAVAIENLEASVALDARSWEAQLQLVLARWRSGALPPVDAARQLTKIEPNTLPGRAEAKFQLGEALLAAGKENAATKAFREAVDAKADHVGATRRLRMRARRKEKAGADGDSKKSGGLRGMFGWGRSKS